MNCEIVVKLKRAKACSYIVEKFLLVMFVLLVLTCIMAALGLDVGEDRASFNTLVQQGYAVFYAQYAFAAVLGSAVFHQATKILEDSLESGSVFLPLHPRRLRTAALLLFVLACVAFVCTLVNAALATGGIPFANIGFGGLGFPSADEWFNAFGAAHADGVGGKVAEVNLTLVMLAAFLWVLSYIFEYGTSMQEEIDSTL